jgi:general secretion pathway protein K
MTETAESRTEDDASMPAGIGDRLRTIRKLYGLSQRELARRAGVTHATISLIESERVSPSVGSLKKVLDGIPLSLAEFFTFDVDEPRRIFYRASELPNMGSGDVAFHLVGAERQRRAMTVLHEDRRENNVDGFDEPWAQPIPPFEAEGFMIFGSIVDLQSRFNINNLVNQNDTQNGAAIDRFRRLIQQFGIEPNAINAVIDWMDRNIAPSGPDGAEDDYYLNLDPPYRPANGRMHSVSELRLVKGFNVDTFDQLAEHLTALPESTSINLNTASMEIWIALGVEPARAEEVAREPITLSEDAESIEDADPEKLEAAASYQSVGEALRQAGLNPDEFDTSGLSVDSEYFLFDGEVRGDRARAVLKSVLHRNKQGIMRVVKRSQGEL